MRASWLLVGVLTAAFPSAALGAPKLDVRRIENLTGAAAEIDEKVGVVKVSVPRNDLSVTIGGVRMTPPMGLTSWAAFSAAGEQTMVMGDMVVAEDQANAVMDAALENGLEVTALHNHFFWDRPKVMFMHVGGMGATEKLARAVGRVFEAIRDTNQSEPKPPKAKIDPAKTTLDPKRIEAILGVSGTLKDGVYKVVVGRETSMHEHPAGKASGVNTWAAFAGSDREAVVDGDFAMLADEVQPVLKRLREADIQVVALHNHMIGEVPTIYFLHYWGIGSTKDLAKGLRAALDVTSRRKTDEPAGASRKLRIDFDDAKPGQLPPRFRSELTGEGAPGSWAIVDGDSGRSLAQKSDDPTAGRFPLCIYEKLTAKDVSVSVRIRPVLGKVDQAGGIVWRYRDPANYYVARANALEDNVVLYKVDAGRRKDLKPVGSGLFAYGRKVEVPVGRWSELRVVAKGKVHAVYFGGEHLFDVEDDTFQEPGRVGLWTKADSVTQFDDLVIERLDETP